MLGEQTRQRGQRDKTFGNETFAPPKLEELGITRMQSHRWQLEDTVSEGHFEGKVLGILPYDYGSSGCQTLFINPGGPWENGYIESFFDKLRDECLNREVFRNGKETQIIVEAWKQEYNKHRPHSSLKYLTPAEFARRYYEKIRVTEVKQQGEKTGTLSL